MHIMSLPGIVVVVSKVGMAVVVGRGGTSVLAVRVTMLVEGTCC